MERLVRFDVARRFATPVARRLGQVAFGLACAGAMMLVRSAVDMVAPTGGPFALVYPTVMIATLYGHLLAGLTAYAVTFVWAWYYILPTVNSFRFEVATDPSRVIVNAVTVLIVVIFAEAFRRAVAHAAAMRDAEIERSALLMEELTHRTKNNFAMAAALLDLQRRGESDPEVRQKLDEASARIHSFAEAYALLAQDQGEGADLDLGPYLERIVERVRTAAFQHNVTFDTAFADIKLPRSLAVPVGLYVNEGLTNCSKYAFPDGRPGRVRVVLDGHRADWRLVIEDNGVGAAAGTANGKPGLGSRLMETFAKQGALQHEAVLDENGCRLSLSSTMPA